MNDADRIATEPDKLGGKPGIRSLRISVEDVLGYPASGMSEQEIIQDFPNSNMRTRSRSIRSPPAPPENRPDEKLDRPRRPSPVGDTFINHTMFGRKRTQFAAKL